MFISCLPLFALNNRVVFFSFVLLEWSHLYTICQLGLVNVFLLPRKCSCCPAMTHMQMSERARGWVYLRRQMRAREKERDKERAIIHIFIFKKNHNETLQHRFIVPFSYCASQAHSCIFKKNTKKQT